MRVSYSLLLFVLSIALAPFARGNPQTSDKDSKQVEVRMIPVKKVIKAGESLEVRVEVWNVGSKQLFIEKEIYELCSCSPLSLSLDLGLPMKPYQGHGCAANCVDNARASFAKRIVERWISLPVGNFYGTVVRMNPDSFPQLRTPGRWRLRGSYRSGGDLSSSTCFFRVALDKQQIEELPYTAWQGEQDTNIVWIDVVGIGSASKTKK
jgi:hypothetical protein